MHLRRLSVVCLLLTLALALAAAACGGGMQTYGNADYNVSFQYDSLFTETSDTTSQGSAGGSSVFKVGFYDEDGTTSDGEYRDGFVLNVYKLNQQVTEDMMPAAKAEIEGLLPQLTQTFGGNAKAGELQEISTNGIQGFKADVSFTMDGVPFASTMYFLISGDVEFQITMQAAKSRWSELQPSFQHVIDTFAVK